MQPRTVHENPWFSVTLTEDRGRSRYRVERADSVLLIGRDAHGDLLMIRGTRDTTGPDVLYEFPCGQIEPSEDPAAAAVRETREETGWEATDLRLIGSSPGISSARCVVYEATVSPGGPLSPEAGEHWVPTTISPGRLRELLATGEVRDSASLAAYALALALANR